MTATGYEFKVVLDRVPTAHEVEELFALPGEPTVEAAPTRGTALVWCTRAGATLADAVADVVAELAALGLHAVRVEAQPWVTLDDIAARLGRSPAAVRLWAAQPDAGGFPAALAAHDLRYWPHVSVWLREHLGYDLPDDDVVLAAASLALQLRDLTPRVPGAVALQRLLVG